MTQDQLTLLSLSVIVASFVVGAAIVWYLDKRPAPAEGSLAQGPFWLLGYGLMFPLGALLSPVLVPAAVIYVVHRRRKKRRAQGAVIAATHA